MTGREKSPGRENDREHYYGKDGLTKSRAVGVTILMGALLLFQLIVFLTGEPEEESGRGGEKPGKITMDEPGSRPGGALRADTLFEFNPNLHACPPSTASFSFNILTVIFFLNFARNPVAATRMMITPWISDTTSFCTSVFLLIISAPVLR